MYPSALSRSWWIALIVSALAVSPGLADSRGFAFSFTTSSIGDEDDDFNEDEPYFIAKRFSFRVDPRTSVPDPASLRVSDAMRSGQNNLDPRDNWAREDNPATRFPYASGSAAVRTYFPWGEAGWVLGTLIVHMEEDEFPAHIVATISSRVESALRQTLTDAIRSGTLMAPATGGISSEVRDRLLRGVLGGIVTINPIEIIRSIGALVHPDDFGGTKLLLAITANEDRAFFYAGDIPSADLGAFTGLSELRGRGSFSFRFNEDTSGDEFGGDHTFGGVVDTWRARTCRAGFVWREAAPGDAVCVPPASRQQARQENALADSRRAEWRVARPTIDACHRGFVWREALAGDRVCTTVARRAEVASENRLASARVEPPAPVPTAAERQCATQLQGRIAHDYSGNRTWPPALLDDLCRGTSNGFEPPRCFQRVMHGGISWGEGTRWARQNVINLCGGTNNATATITCFEGQIRAGRGWSAAIAACRRPT